MRLDDYDPNIQVEDQRGEGSGGFGGGGGGGLLFGLLPLIGSRFGCGGIVVVLLLFAVFGGLGHRGSMIGGGQGGAPSQVGQRQGGSPDNAASACAVDTESKAACNAFSSADNTWKALFAKSGQRFDAPKLVFYGGSGRSGCGAAQSAMGPFYCPTDQGIYFDTSFFNELAGRFGAKGDFAQDYVIAHEFGHHIQNLLGTSEQVQRVQHTARRQQPVVVRLPQQSRLPHLPLVPAWAQPRVRGEGTADCSRSLTQV